MMLLISLALVSLRHMARQLFGSDVSPFLCKHMHTRYSIHSAIDGEDALCYHRK